jgi:hypothetical protein
VQKREAGAFQLLQDEALPAEEAGAKTLRERDADVDVTERAEERVLLTGGAAGSEDSTE